MTARKMAKKRKQPKRITAQPKQPDKVPFVEHLYEFRARVLWVVLVVIAFSVFGYVIRNQLINFLLEPSKGQNFIYTTPGGGLNFILQVSIEFGIVIAIPVIIYQSLRYLEPLLANNERVFIFKCALLSASLAAAGMAFGYFVGLPAALAFLSDQFINKQISALLTLNDYLSFVTTYMLGSALMFQIPVILLFINRVKPLSAKKLAVSQRWVILIAFIAAAVITPTPDIFNQAIIAIPIILVYQLGVVLVAYQNRYSRTVKASRLRAQDKKAHQERARTADQLLPVDEDLMTELPSDVPALAIAPAEAAMPGAVITPSKPASEPIAAPQEAPAPVIAPVPVSEAVTAAMDEPLAADVPASVETVTEIIPEPPAPLAVLAPTTTLSELAATYTPPKKPLPTKPLNLDEIAPPLPARLLTDEMLAQKTPEPEPDKVFTPDIPTPEPMVLAAPLVTVAEPETVAEATTEPIKKKAKKAKSQLTPSRIAVLNPALFAEADALAVFAREATSDESSTFTHHSLTVKNPIINPAASMHIAIDAA